MTLEFGGRLSTLGFSVNLLDGLGALVGVFGLPALLAKIDNVLRLELVHIGLEL